jgi:hypothetical protein
MREPALLVGKNVSSGEGYRRLRILRYGPEPRYGPVEPGRVGRHGEHPRVKAAEKSGYVFQTRRVEQEGALSSGNTLVLQSGRDSLGLQVQLPVLYGTFFGFPVSQEGVGSPPRLVGGPPAQKIHHGSGFKIGFFERSSKVNTSAFKAALLWNSGLHMDTLSDFAPRLRKHKIILGFASSRVQKITEQGVLYALFAHDIIDVDLRTTTTYSTWPNFLYQAR